MSAGFIDFMDFTKQQLNMPDAQAQQFEENLRKTFGGDRIAVPKNDQQLRNREIRAEYNGKNVRRLSERYGLSVQAIEKIVNG
jgi:Mor family transcriptional regulator